MQVSIEVDRSRDLFDSDDDDSRPSNPEGDSISRNTRSRSRQNETIVLSEDDLALEAGQIPDHDTIDSEDEEYSRESEASSNELNLGALFTRSPGPSRSARSGPSSSYNTRRGARNVQTRTNQSSSRNHRQLLGEDDFGHDSDSDDDGGWLTTRNARARANQLFRSSSRRVFPNASNRKRSRSPLERISATRIPNRSINVDSKQDEEMARRLQEQYDYEFALRLADESQQPSPVRLQELRELNRTIYPKRRRLTRDVAYKTQPVPSRSNQASSSQEENIPQENAEEMRCVICFDDEPKDPVACLICQTLVGCELCVRKWVKTSNMSNLNRDDPLSVGMSSANHKACPLCRAEWGRSPAVVPYKEMQQIRRQNGI